MTKGPSPKKKPSYLKEMLTHQWSLYGFLGAVASGAALSIVSGGLAAVPFIGFLAAEGIASLFIPSSGWWQEKVDKKYRREHREKLRSYLLGEIERRMPLDSRSPQWDTYKRLRARIASLEETAREAMTSITESDTERLDDATVNYLSLWLLTLLMKERQQAYQRENVDKKLDDVKRKLKSGDLQSSDRNRLEKAEAELTKVIERRTSVETRQHAAESSMLNLADSLEEVYQNVMRNPTGADVKAFLQHALEGMKIEEDVQHDMDTDLREAFAELERLEHAKGGTKAEGDKKA